MRSRPKDHQPLTVTRLAGHIGAEIGGVDLTQPLDGPTVVRIRDALLTHRVIFFRDQLIDHDQHLAFARNFGKPTFAHPHKAETPQGYPEILTIDPHVFAKNYGISQRERRRTQNSYLSGWHTDLTPLVNPVAACILRAETVPDFGGDTTWTNLVAAYEDMSEPLRRLADGLDAEHRFMASINTDRDGDAYQQQTQDNPMVAIHPVVRVHPETGERALFVNPCFTSRIVGLSQIESRRLLELFFEQITAPAFTVRFRWQPGSIAFWDNRTTAHLAPMDLDHTDESRRLFRVSLVGDVPIGVDGRASKVVAGAPYRAADDKRSTGSP